MQISIKKNPILTIKTGLLVINFVCILILIIVANTDIEYKSLLPNQNSWQSEGSFIHDGEFPSDKRELSDRKEKHEVPELWASWAGSDGNIGHLVSESFLAPSKMMLFIVGYPNHSLNQSNNPGEKWKKITVSLPATWRRNSVRLVAIDAARDLKGWLGLSTPFKLPWWYFFKQYALLFIAFFLLVFLIPGFAPSSLSGFNLQSIYRWAGLAGICYCLIHLRYVGSEAEQLRTNILFTYLFLLSAPFFYICSRILLPKLLSMFLFSGFILLALFPYKLFYASEINLCTSYQYPPPETVFGLPGYWVLIILGFIALFVTLCWWLLKKRKYGWILPRKEVAVCFVLLAILLLQILPRLNDHSPRMVNKGVQRECKGRCTIEFFGHCVMCDVDHHAMINGMYKGVPDDYKIFVINRRALSPFLYSLIETYMDPYYAIIVINSIFLYLIMLAGYTLALHFNLNRTVAIVFAILLSANMILHQQTVEGVFYVSKTAFAFFILTVGYKLRIFSQTTSWKQKLLFCSILACSSLTYDPYITVVFLFLWAFLHAICEINTNVRSSGRIMLHGIFYSMAPMLSLFILESILGHYGLEGNSDNIGARSDVLEKVLLLPAYFFNNMDKIYKLADHSINTLVFRNPRSDEYLALLGSFGVVSFFAIMPGYIKSENRKGLYAIFLATLLLPLVAKLSASIPPLAKYSYIYLDRNRTTDYLPALILSQSIGIYHLAKVCCKRLPLWIKPSYFVYSATLFIFIYSYYNIFSAIFKWKT